MKHMASFSKEVTVWSRIFFFFLTTSEVNVLGIVCHKVSITTTKLCHCNVKAAIENISTVSVVCSKTFLFVKIVGGSMV